MHIIETERLFLRELNTGDAAFILELLNTPSWLKYIGNSKVKNIEEAEAYIARVALASYEKNGFGLYFTGLKDGDIPIGLCGFIKRDTLEDVDIGFAFLPEYDGKGFGFEAATACMDHAGSVLGLRRVVAITMEANIRSINLLKRLGFHFERMVKMPNDEELMLFAN